MKGKKICKETLRKVNSDTVQGPYMAKNKKSVVSVCLGFVLIYVFMTLQAALAQEGFSQYARGGGSRSRQDGVIDLFVGVW